jgi:hypothetical protein
LIGAGFWSTHGRVPLLHGNAAAVSRARPSAQTVIRENNPNRVTSSPRQAPHQLARSIVPWLCVSRSSPTPSAPRWAAVGRRWPKVLAAVAAGMATGGLTATRLAKSLALVPSMTSLVRRSSLIGRCQEMEEPTTSCIKRALLGFRVMIGKWCSVSSNCRQSPRHPAASRRRRPRRSERSGRPQTLPCLPLEPNGNPARPRP